MPRREFTAKIKVAAFDRAGGCCEECGAKLFPGNIHYDHMLPDALGGGPDLGNCQVLCRNCHGAKTARQDVPTIARVKRKKASNIGAKDAPKNIVPGSKLSPWKRKANGEVVRRDEG